MLKTFSLIVTALIAVILAYAATKPNVCTIQRSIEIHATPAAISDHISDLHKWQLWSPYEKLDPTMTKTFGGAATGVGATYEWSGNQKAGAGRISISQATSQQVSMKLEMLRPFKSTNRVEFTLVPKANATDKVTTTTTTAATIVTWTMVAPTPYIAKVLNVFVNMDNMIGKEFEEGLSNLKNVAENN